MTLPLVLPPTVLGYYLLVLLGRDAWLGRMYEQVTGSSLVFTWHGAVVAALLHSAPLLVKTARAALESVDHSYERAARTSGRFGVAVVLESHLAAGLAIDSGWAPRFALRDPGRFWRDADGRRQYSRPHADRGGRDLRRG